MTIPVFPTTIIDLRPKYMRRKNPTIVAKKLTIPIKAVIVEADISSPLKIKFE